MSDFRNPDYVATLDPSSVIGRSGFASDFGAMPHHHAHGGGIRGGFGPYPVIVVDIDDLQGWDASQGWAPHGDWHSGEDWDPTGELGESYSSKTGGIR